MTRLSVCLLLLASLAWGADITSAWPGIASAGATWVGGVAPGPSDRAILAGHSVTVPAGAPITWANLTVQGAAQILQTGSALTVTGTVTPDAANAGYTNCSPWIIMSTGTTLRFGSVAPASGAACRGIEANGTLGAGTTVEAAGAYATMRGQLKATYTKFGKLGDASHPGIEFTYHRPTGNNPVKWDVSNSWFDECGAMLQVITGLGIEEGGTFRHVRNKHTRTKSAYVFTGTLNILPSDEGVREIIDNTFDAPAFEVVYFPRFVIDGNQFMKGGFGGNYFAGAQWKSFWNNLLVTEYAPSVEMEGDVTDNIWYLREAQSFNPHGPAVSRLGDSVWSGNLIFHEGEMSGTPSYSVSSFWHTITAGANSRHTLRGNFYLPNSRREQSFWMSAFAHALTTDYAGARFFLENNTAFLKAGHDGRIALTSRHATAQKVPEGTFTFRSNLLWNPDPAQPVFKIYAYRNDEASTGGPNINACLPSECDYNGAWNALTTGGSEGWVGAANGYLDGFSGGVPGVHDVSGNPNFVDQWRNPVLFDRDYLGNTPPAWNPAGSYVEDDMVSNADATIFGGAIINYNYWDGTFGGATCNGQNPKPGDYSALAHACWEPATLRRMREAKWLGSKYNDIEIGVYGGDINETVSKWVKAGLRPTNPAFSSAGHKTGSDGVYRNDIGAAPVRLAPPVTGN